MNERCFQSASSCDRHPYIGELYLQKILILLFILWNTEYVILVKILLDATFSGYPLTESFLCEQIHSENSYENHWQHFFWSLLCSFASNTADLKNSIFNLTHKVPPEYVIWNKKITEKKAISSLHWNGSDKISRCIDVCIQMHYLDNVTRIYMYIIWLANFRQ